MRSPPPSSGHSDRKTADSVAVTIWGGAEGAITIIAASIPVLRALVRGDETHYAARFDTTDERRLNSTSLENLNTDGGRDKYKHVNIHGV
jgi:hypothetical protein